MRKYLIAIALFLTTSRAVAQTDSLATYMRAAAQNNPQVLAQWQVYQSAVAAVCLAGTLNDPTLSVGFYPESMELVNGRQVATFSLMQMFPWPGTLKAAKSEKSWQAQALYQQYREKAIDVAFQVERQWYTILSTKEQFSAIEANLDILHRMQELATYRYKAPSKQAGASNMSDLLRLESREVSLQEQLATTQSRLQMEQRQLNLLMHRDADSPLVLPDSVALKVMPDISLADVTTSSPMLAALKAQGASYTAMGEKARKMGLPMVGIGVEYMLNNKTDMPRMEDMNGKDMWMPMLSVSLPVYRHKTRAQQRQAELMKQSAELSYDSQIDQVQAQLLSIRQRAEELQSKIQLYDRQLALSNQTLALMEKEYVVGSTSLTDILATHSQQVDLGFRKAEAKAQYNTVVAELEQLAAINDFSSSNQK